MFIPYPGFLRARGSVSQAFYALHSLPVPHFMCGDACGRFGDGGRQKCVGRQKAICSEKEDQARDFMCDILKHSKSVVRSVWKAQRVGGEAADSTRSSISSPLWARQINLALKWSGEMSAYYEVLTSLLTKSSSVQLVTC